jgi:hypothetical protein
VLAGVPGSGLAEEPRPRTEQAPTCVGVPKYVVKCPNSKWQKAVPYQLLLWRHGDPTQASMVTATCRSWRCEGQCRRHNGKVTWARIVEAVEPHDENDVLFAVLTIDQNGYYSQRRWDSSYQAYKELSRMMGMFLKRLNRLLERSGVEGIASRWVAVVEQHRTGWPHVNVLIVCPALAKIVREQQAELEATHDEVAERIAYARERERSTWPRFPPFEKWLDHRRSLMRGEVLRHAEGAGWGRRSTLEVARSRAAVAGYFVKLCGLHDEPGTSSSREQLSGEVVKLSQIPMAAPKGFRRLRSGVRFLPPRRKSEYTGALFDDGAPVELLRWFKRARALRDAMDRALDRSKVSPPPELLASLQADHERDMARLRDIAAALEAARLESRGYRKIVELLRAIVSHADERASEPRGSPGSVTG